MLENMRYINPDKKLKIIGNLNLENKTLFEVLFQESNGPIPIKNKSTRPIGIFNWLK